MTESNCGQALVAGVLYVTVNAPIPLADKSINPVIELMTPVPEIVKTPPAVPVTVATGSVPVKQ